MLEKLKGYIAARNIQKSLRSVEKILEKREMFFFSIGAIIFWFLFLGVSKTLFSGYHLTDDHEFIRIAYDLKSNSLIEVIQEWLQRDFLIRFRPFYYLHRVILIEIFDTNFLLLSIYNAVLAIITTILLYRFARLIKLQPLVALLFIVFILIGPQTAIWWRLGPNETIALTLFAVTLNLLHLNVTAKKNILATRVLYLFFVLLVSLSKESFIFMLPILVMIELYLKTVIKGIPLKKAIKKDLLSNIAIALLFIAEILIINFYIGTSKVGYAGVSGMTVAQYMTTLNALVNTSKLLMITVLTTALIVLYRTKNSKELIQNTVTYIRKYYLIVLLGAFVVLTQTFLHTKSGIFERYLIPGVLGLTILVAFNLREIFQSKSIEYWIKVTLVIYIFTILITSLNQSYNTAQIYANDGIHHTNTMNKINAITDKDDKILVVADPYNNHEWGFSLSKYTKEKLGRENIYSYAIYDSKNQDSYYKSLVQGYEKLFSEETVVKESTSEMYDSVFIFTNVLETFELDNQDWFNDKEYKRYDYGFVQLYDKR